MKISISSILRMSLILLVIVVGFFYFNRDLLESAWINYHEEIHFERTQHVKDSLSQKLESWRSCESDQDCVLIVQRCRVYSVHQKHHREAEEYYAKRNAVINCKLTSPHKEENYAAVCESGLCNAKSLQLNM